MEETIISTRNIYTGRVVNVDVHEVRLHNGEHTKREQVQHPGAVAIVALDDQKQVLMVRQFRLPAQQVLFELPAGTLQPGEPPQESAVREMQEETGYKPATLEALGGFFVAPGYTTEYIHLFYATDLRESRLAMDADEFLELVRVPLPEALAMIERGEIIDAKTIIGLLRIARRLGV